MQFLSAGAGLAALSNGSGSVASRLDWLPKQIARSRSRATQSVRDWFATPELQAKARLLLMLSHTLRLNVTHFRVGLRLFVGEAGASTVELSLGEDRFCPWPLSSLVGLLASALVVSLAIVPPSFSHRSSIFFFRRFRAIGSGIAVSSLLFHFKSTRVAKSALLLTPILPIKAEHFILAFTKKTWFVDLCSLGFSAVLPSVGPEKQRLPACGWNRKERSYEEPRL